MKKLIQQAALLIFFLWFSSFNSASAFSEKISTDSYTSSKVCGECHKDIYNKWKNSIHSHSVVDPIFMTAYKEAYLLSGGQAKFRCLKCHAPTVAVTKDYDMKKAITREGITCDFCHSVKGIKLSGPNYVYESDVGMTKRGPIKNSETDKHKTEYSRLHEKSEFCAGCHDYVSNNGVPILETYSEWKEGPYAVKGIQCQNCHMPLAKGEITVSKAGKKRELRLINEHNLVGGHSVAQVKKALKVEIVKIEREGNRLNILVDVTNKGSGHKLPTGIPTRKVQLKVQVKMSSGRVLQEKIFYEKVMTDKNGMTLTRDSEIMLGLATAISKDNRIAPKETRRESFTFYGVEDEAVVVTAKVEYRYTPLLLQPVEMKIEMGRDEKVLE